MTATITEPTTDRPRRARGRLAVAAALVTILVVAVVVVLSRTHSKDEKAPYVDPHAAGLLTLCSKDGKAVTSGKVKDRPFADVVLGKTGLPSGSHPEGAVATLFAYQPRAGVEPVEFSGAPMSASTGFTDTQRPAADVTADDWSVSDFVTAYPATDDGYVQLRLILGTAQDGTLSEDHYDTADLRVDGDSWELVRGGHASCAGAKALVP
jgi:hypothetical protein